MKILEIYNGLITEAEITSCVKKFGYELFGHELGGNEPNTNTENNYLDLIKSFTDTNYGTKMSDKFIKSIEVLKGCVNQYPEVLIPEKTKVFRGIEIPIRYFIENNQTINTSGSIPYIYKANSQIQSWSNSFDIGGTFGNHNSLNDTASEIELSEFSTAEARQNLLKILIEKNLKVAFVLEYDTNTKEFIFKSKYFRMLSSAHHEDELIRIDNRPIKTLAHFNNSEDVFLTMKGLTLLKYINAGIKGI